MKIAIPFKPRARLMSQLGDQLIKDENIAVLELVKNSYDADATEVYISIDNVEHGEFSSITIEDNGDGMTLDTVKNCWMEPGTDNKEKRLVYMLENNKRSKFNRLPIGEKGIGRFGVHKLGNRITLETRSKGGKEIDIKIDWTIFNSNKYLSDIPIEIIENDSERKFLGESYTGTKIVIEALKTRWTRARIRELYRSINSLNSPFQSIDSFNVVFNIDKKEWLEGLIKYDDVKEYSLFNANMVLSKDKIKNYQYHFTPWKSMKKLDERKYIISEIDMFTEVKEILKNGSRRRSLKSIDLSEYKIGEVEINLLSFDLDSSILKMGVKDISGLKKYLKANGGIFIYRDNMRIYDGENDWLGLDSKRVNSPGEKITNNLVLGSVNIKRSQSSDLIEKTNREGFIENEAYDLFKEAVNFAVDKFQRDRAQDKEKIKMYYGVTSKSEPVIAGVTALRGKVKDKIDDKKLEKQILGCLDNIEKDYKHITEVYQKSSSVGLSMSVVLHEIDKIISELEYAIVAENSSKHIKTLVKRLDRLTDGYASIIKSKSIKRFNLKKMITQSLFMVDFRLKAHEIVIDKNYLKSTIDINIRGNESLLCGNIINIIDNSIWWLNYAKIVEKKIYIDITRDILGYVSIIIADNGKGFTIPTDMATKPFITDKPGGMGLGLHLVSELMKQHGGELFFPEFDDLQLPEEYKQGAILALSFKEDKII